MINSSKNTTITAPTQIAGLNPGDSNIEFLGDQQTKEVFWVQHGRTLEWKHLPKWAYRVCQEQYLNDKKAMSDLRQLNISNERQVEIYIYHLYGDLDATADILNGKLTSSENYRHSKKDPSIKWDYKWITIGNSVLNDRDIQIIDLILEGKPDKAIAFDLGISQSTLDFHKKNLFKKVGVQSKIELIITALKHHV